MTKEAIEQRIEEINKTIDMLEAKKEQLFQEHAVLTVLEKREEYAN